MVSVNDVAKRIIREPVSRRIFFAALVLALGVCLLIQAYVLPNALTSGTPVHTLVNNVLLTLEVSIVTTLGTSVLVIWFTPEALQQSAPEARLEVDQLNRISDTIVDRLQAGKESGVTIINHEEIEENVLSAAKGSTTYKYKGHLGRFPSGAVIPTLVASSSEDLVNRDVHLLLLDPTSDACEAFVEYKQQAESFYSEGESDDAGRRKDWSVERIRNEIVGTIVSTYIYDNKTLIDADVSLVPTASLFRVEVFDEAAIITRENPQMPAMRVKSESDHYNAYKSDMLLARAYGTRLPNIPDHEVPSWEEVTAEKVERLLGIITEEMSDHEFGEMIDDMSPHDWETVVTNIKDGDQHERDFPYDDPRESTT